MGIRFNADEVLAMAERIEENGAAFYRKAADLHRAPNDVRFLLQLAEMEDRHRATFAAMRASLDAAAREETVYDPYLEAELYLNAMADSHGGEGTRSVLETLSEKDTVEDLLRLAIQLERHSIAFYVGLLEMIPPRLGQSKVQEIIAEERQHVATLAAELRKRRG